MGLQIILNIHQFDPGTVIDIASANTALMATPHGGFGELYDEFVNLPDWDGPLKMMGNSLKIAQNWDGGFDGYEDSTMVWGCCDDDVFKTIAAHITNGKVVFNLDIEGHDAEYYVCTPGAVKKVTASSIAF